ncbi:MAG: RNA methyltransferase [Candidatus Omnitrophica bacterium]|nr:RNA methyltransferase [Candidatus Omnitrophota bacterium]
MKKEKIAIILVSPENPDNIGAVARAAKNMDFADLRLVAPPRAWRAKAKKMAMSAADILEKGKTYPSLQNAIQDLGMVVGTTRRAGGQRGAFLSFDRAILKIRESSCRQKIGIVFGRESKGLANEDSALCDHLVTIPTGPAYPSLNLAQAVMVTLFALSWNRPSLRSVKETVLHERALNKNEIEITIKHFEEALKALGYKKGGADLLPRILRTFRGLIKRGGLLEPEAQMIKGLSRKIREKILNDTRHACRMNQKES